MCKNDFYTCLPLYHTTVWYTQRPEKDIRQPTTEGTEGWESWCECWKSNLHQLEELQVLLITETTLKPLELSFHMIRKVWLTCSLLTQLVLSLLTPQSLISPYSPTYLIKCRHVHCQGFKALIYYLLPRKLLLFFRIFREGSLSLLRL